MVSTKSRAVNKLPFPLLFMRELTSSHHNLVVTTRTREGSYTVIAGLHIFIVCPNLIIVFVITLSKSHASSVTRTYRGMRQCFADAEHVIAKLEHLVLLTGYTWCH